MVSQFVDGTATCLQVHLPMLRSASPMVGSWYSVKCQALLPSHLTSSTQPVGRACFRSCTAVTAKGLGLAQAMAKMQIDSSNSQSSHQTKLPFG